jgi:DNA-binding FadR family transcriptional regulator
VTQRAKLRDVAIDSIRNRIRQDRLRVGDSLPTERALAEELRVSRTVVREALAGLEMRGLLDLSPGRPPRVVADYDRAFGDTLSLAVDEDPQALLDLIEVRQMVEVEAAGLAAVRCRATDLIAMHTAQQSMHASISEPGGYVTADIGFHTALLEAARNRILSILFGPVAELLQESRQRTAWKRRPATEAWQEHQRILECIEAGDAAGARLTMAAHLASTRRDLSASLAGGTGDETATQ